MIKTHKIKFKVQSKSLQNYFAITFRESPEGAQSDGVFECSVRLPELQAPNSIIISNQCA